MDTNVALTPGFPEPLAAATPATTAPPVPAPGSATGGASVSAPDQGRRPGDVRLVIEEGPVRGGYVYKTVDRLTGETLQQFPREDVLRFKTAPDYDPGDVFNGLS
jgi:flagellar protein FlaG